MITITRNFIDKVIRVNAEKYMEEQAEELLNIIGKLDINKFTDNYKIQIGCIIYILKEKEGEFIVFSSDFSKNPVYDITDDLTIPLWIQLEQGILLNKVGVTGELVSCFDKIICSKGVLNLDDIYLERIKGYEKGDSGWFIGSLDENDKEEELEVFYIYDIIKLRPSIMQILSLPSGYMAVFNKENLVAVVDDDDNDILKLNI